MRAEAVDRVKLVFSLFDVDGNGYLESDDFDLMSSRVNAVAAGSGPEAKDAMRRAFQRYWTTLVTEMDADGDGRVSYEEFVGCVLSPERFTPTVGDFAAALSALGDPDGDGRVERPLFTDLMLAIGFSPANIDALFDAFGPDADGQITVPTWREGIEEFYAPDRAGIPGDRLVSGA
ncbi:EF-hand domain-containing protein [Streptomyces sp. Z26]|uniref:EF-hand domain-containing protein n=1 Tax=Streptomyces TaxID=1883 RepID=UPI000EF14D69|nr:EF-hand domain-containing protein [Streptomyces sp. Z26]RLL66334.1 calcium-binding protein [Streptomyces sp. Z26]